jgi:hypothetical protein
MPRKNLSMRNKSFLQPTLTSAGHQLTTHKTSNNKLMVQMNIKMGKAIYNNSNRLPMIGNNNDWLMKLNIKRESLTRTKKT